MIKIYTDVHITKNKTLCHAFSPDGKLLRSEKSLAAMIAWLWDTGHSHTLIETAEGSFSLNIVKTAH